MKAMCPLSYYDNGFMATHALRTPDVWLHRT